MYEALGVANINKKPRSPQENIVNTISHLGNINENHNQLPPYTYYDGFNEISYLRNKNKKWLVCEELWALYHWEYEMGTCFSKQLNRSLESLTQSYWMNQQSPSAYVS